MRTLCAVVVGLAAALNAAPASGRPLTTGFNITSSDASSLGQVAREGAGTIRVNLLWRSVAPAHRPKGFRPAAPNSPGYDWSATDALVTAAAKHHLRVLMTVLSAPDWAEGGHRTARAPAGTWRPNSAQFSAFVTAAAKRYSGRFHASSSMSTHLPRVRRWQLWNEPNLSNYLTPQWTHSRHGFAMASPGTYRRLLNAGYSALKRVSPSNFVLGAGTAPYGDLHKGGNRIPPVAFTRSVFCLGGAGLRSLPCPHPAHLDGIAHHPYGVSGPHRRALNRDDVAVPDIGKLTRVLHVAERRHRVAPGGHKQVWITEISWDTRPPDPDGVPLARQARWVEESFYVLWRQGVGTVLWLSVRDNPPTPSYGTTYQGGLYYLRGRAKPAATAFRFPFVVEPSSRGRLAAWGRAPATGKLSVQRHKGSGWTTVRRLPVHRRAVFTVHLPHRGSTTFRAVLGSDHSLTWTVK